MTRRMKCPRLVRQPRRRVLDVLILMAALSGGQSVTAIAGTATPDRNVLRIGSLGYTDLRNPCLASRIRETR